MTAWRWIRRDTVLAIHDAQLSQHGGLDGVKDDNMIESALARPIQLESYGDPEPDAFDLAAAYGFNIARNHGFSDGNKHTAWIAIRLFLEDNGAKKNYISTDAIFLMLGVADGTISEKQIASWLRDRAC